jgi:hypothetical protein
MARSEDEIVTHHFVETASRNRQSIKVARYHNQWMQGLPVPATKDRPAGFPAARRRLGIKLIGRKTMRRIDGEEIAGHIGRNPLVRTSGAHLASEIWLVRDFT